MAIQGIIGTQDTSLALPGSKSSLRVASRTGGNDTVSLSQEALNVASGDGIRNNKVYANLSGDQVVFDNATGKITWGNTKLDLKPIGNALKDDIIVEKTADGFRVMNYTDNSQLLLDKNGKATKNIFGKPDVTSGFVGPATNGALFISNKEWGVSGTSYNDVLINRRANSDIYAGAGDDKIFNLNAKLSSIDTVAGNDAVYSVGLRAGAKIDTTGSDASYVKLLGSVQGASIAMGGDHSLLDAKGKRVANSTIQTSATAASSFMTLGTLEGGTLNANGAVAGIDARRIAGAKIAFGSGENSLVADTLTGSNGASGSITAGAGSRNTVRAGSFSNTTLDLSKSEDNAITLKRNASNGSILLGAGENSVDAGNRTLHNMVITSVAQKDADPDASGGSGTSGGSGSSGSSGGTGTGATAGHTAIAAGNITGDKARGSTITLGGDGNTVSVKGTVRNTTMDMGTGANTFSAKNVSNLNLTAGGSESSEEQTISIAKNATDLTYTGSQGTDTLNVGGTMRGGSMNLGEGDNNLAVTKGMLATNVSAAENSSTNISATSYTGTADSVMSLGNGGNSLSFSKKVTNLTATLGSGSNTFAAGSVGGAKGVSLSAAPDSTADQTVSIKGSASKLSFDGGSGVNTLTVGGNLTASSIDFSEGTNTLTVAKDMRGTSVDATGEFSTTTIKAGAIRNGLNSYTRINLGDGGNNVQISRSVGGGTDMDLGAGSNTFRSRSVLGTSGRQVNLVAGGPGSTMAQDVVVYGKANHFNYTGSDGEDSLSIRDAVRHSSINLGYGDKHAGFVAGSTVNLTWQEGPPPSPDDPNAGIGGGAVGGPDDGIALPDLGGEFGGGMPLPDLGLPEIGLPVDPDLPDTLNGNEPAASGNTATERS